MTSVKNAYDAQLANAEQALANDPPDQSFTTVPKPAAIQLPNLGLIGRHAPHFVRLARNYAAAAALVQALVIAQNRATGAFQAMTNGDATAAGALRAQNAAVLSYAARAARILRGQPSLARKAFGELRSLGRHSRAIAVGLMRPKATEADRLAAASLLGIGH